MSVLFVWIAFYLLSSLKCIIQYIITEYIHGRQFSKFSNLMFPSESKSWCLCILVTACVVDIEGFYIKRPLILPMPTLAKGGKDASLPCPLWCPQMIYFIHRHTIESYQHFMGQFLWYNLEFCPKLQTLG